MKVLMLVKNSEIGGVASCVKSLTEGLEKYKKVKTVIGISEGESLDYMLKNLDVRIIDFKTISLKTVIGNYFKICKIIKEKNIDIIHAQNRIPALYASLYHFFHSKVPYIWSNHLVPIPSSLIFRLTTKYGACAVAEGISGRDMLIEKLHIPNEKVKIVNLGVDFSTFARTKVEEQKNLRKEFKIEESEKVILLYGRLHPVKGHLFLLDAIHGIDEKYKLVFPGENSTYKNEILQKAQQYGIEDRILFPGYIKGSDWLSISNLMVLPSKQEGFGIVNVEAFTMGVPVIRTKTGGYEDMQDLCFGVEYGNTKELNILLKEFFTGDAKFSAKTELAQRQSVRFSLESYTNGYYDIYMRALKG